MTSATEAPAPKPAVPTDEKVYLGFVALGLVIIATFFTITLVRSHRAELARQQVPARQLGDFVLTNRTGATVRRADLQGQWLVANFVFTSCGISCLQVNQRMAEIQKRTEGRSDVRLLSFSVDPYTDTPSTLARFAERYKADPVRWLFLTGEKQVLYPLIETSFLGPVSAMPLKAQPAGMIHSDQIALMDGEGRLRGLFDGLKPGVADEIVAALEGSPDRRRP